MGEPIFDLSNTSNWQYLDGYQKAAEYVPNGRYYYPIGTIVFPLQVTSNIFCIRVDTSNRRKGWYSAGLLDIKIFTSFNSNTLSPDTSIYPRQALWLSEFRVIRIDRLVQSFAIHFLPQKWLEAVDINVWYYVGNQADTDDPKFDKIQSSLDRIEVKVNGS